MALWIVGLGVEAGQMTARARQLLASGAKVVLRTGRCPAADYLRRENIPFTTLDHCYEQAQDFDQLAHMLSDQVAALSGDVVYGVLDIRDESVSRLLEKCPHARLIPGVPVEGPLWALALGPCQMAAASDLEDIAPDSSQGALIREITSPTLASEVKIALMEVYPPDGPLYLWQGEEGLLKTTLEELDRQDFYDHRTSAFVPAQGDVTGLERLGFRQLQKVVDILRGPDGCPWDGEQTHESLRPYCVEEAWEVSDAIDREDPDDLMEELGDLLLQVCLHENIARQYGEFNMVDITTAIGKKMIRRHPHVFGSRQVSDLNGMWDQIKAQEKGGVTPLSQAGRELPALMRAQKVLGKAEKKGLCLEAEGPEGEKQLGQYLLRACQAARRQGIDAERALRKAIEEFAGDLPQKDV